MGSIHQTSARETGIERERVLISAGPTQEHIDPARFITNGSSGKMGYALASEAVLQGADVVLVSGPTSLQPPVWRHPYFGDYGR